MGGPEVLSSDVAGYNGATALEAWIPEPIAWILPGEGEAGSQCDSWRMVALCHAEKLVWRRHKWCRRIECPVCWTDAVRAEASRAAHRLLTGWRILGRGHIRHAIISWPLDRQPETIDDLDAALALARKLLAIEGWLGYSLVIHPFRGRCSKCGRDLESEESCCGTKVYDRPGFHLHALGVKLYHEGRAAWDAHALVYKNRPLRGRDDQSLYTRVLATYNYELGHAGRPGRGRHSIRWCAALSYSKMKTDEEEKGQGPQSCPSCGNDLEPIAWQAQDGTALNVQLWHDIDLSWTVKDWPEPDPEPPPRHCSTQAIPPA